MPGLSFTLRDLFWLMLVVGLGVGWWTAERQRIESTAQAVRLPKDVDEITVALRRNGIDWNGGQQLVFRRSDRWPRLGD
jgi:hypothetical protein